DLADLDGRPVLLIISLDGRFVGRTPVNGAFLRYPTMPTDCFYQEGLGRVLVAVLGEEKVNRLAMFVDGTIQILPLAFHPNIRFVHAPADVHGPFASMQRFFQQGAIFDDPSINGGVIQLHPAFFHEFFDVACAQGIRQIPPDAHENDLLRKMRPLETDRHRRTPSCITVDHRGRAYRKSPQMKIATKPLGLRGRRAGGRRKLGLACLRGTVCYCIQAVCGLRRCTPTVPAAILEKTRCRLSEGLTGCKRKNTVAVNAGRGGGTAKGSATQVMLTI